ncbi:MAG: aminopeptidase [Thermoplasmata archaeon]|nr:aminopeptidase [Thermoplasmata archaeon]
MAKKRKKDLEIKRENVWLKLKKDDLKKVEITGEKLLNFMEAKTEREVVAKVKELAIKQGFVDINRVSKIKPGMKLFAVNREKTIALIVVGRRRISEGLNLVVSHTDAPRLDLKQMPLVEDSGSELCFLDTHYYGGIKNYQWVSIPLELRGVFVLESGKKVEVSIGEKEGIFFMIPDLPPHLDDNVQGKRKLLPGIKGEELNVLAGSIPHDTEKSPLKLNVLRILNQKYGITEEDFVSAELELVPAWKPAYLGFDKGLIAAYGLDDRVCVFASVEAISGLKVPDRTCIAYAVDKEEIGSDTNTSVTSMFLENLVRKLIQMEKGHAGYVEVLDALLSSKAVSADVKPGVDPIYKGVYDATNAVYVNHGMGLTRGPYHGGKKGANEANAEFLHQMRVILDNAKVPWQFGNSGRMDEGGGGTVARYLATRGMEVVDAGVPMIAMHAPVEIVGKVDVFSAVKGFRAFFEYPF